MGFSVSPLKKTPFPSVYSVLWIQTIHSVSELDPDAFCNWLHGTFQESCGVWYGHIDLRSYGNPHMIRPPWGPGLAMAA